MEHYPPRPMIPISLCPDTLPEFGVCGDESCQACAAARAALPIGRRLAMDPGVWMLHGSSDLEEGVQVIVLSFEGKLFNLHPAEEIPLDAVPEDAIACGPYSAEDGGSVVVQRERLDDLLELEREVAAFLTTYSGAIRVREGGGPENLAASLGTNLAILTGGKCALARVFAESNNQREKDKDEEIINKEPIPSNEPT